MYGFSKMVDQNNDTVNCLQADGFCVDTTVAAPSPLCVFYLRLIASMSWILKWLSADVNDLSYLQVGASVLLPC